MTREDRSYMKKARNAAARNSKLIAGGLALGVGLFVWSKRTRVPARSGNQNGNDGPSKVYPRTDPLKPGRDPGAPETPPSPPSLCPGSPCSNSRTRLQFGGGGPLGALDASGVFLYALAGLNQNDMSDPGNLQYYSTKYPAVIAYPLNAQDVVDRAVQDLARRGASADEQVLERSRLWTTLGLHGYCIPVNEPHMRPRVVRTRAAMGAWLGSSAVSWIPAGACVVTFDTINHAGTSYERTVYNSPDFTVHAGWMRSIDLE